MVDIDICKNCFDFDSCNININGHNFLITFMGNGDLYWVYDTNDLDVSSYSFIVDKENYFLYSSFKELYETIKASCYKEDELISSSDVGLYKDGVITWYSDDYPLEDANSFSIEQVLENYKVTFRRSSKTPLVGFNNLSIRICNSGSRYNPYNIPFMRMYNELRSYDYQMHIEEILYQKKLSLKKI